MSLLLALLVGCTPETSHAPGPPPGSEPTSSPHDTATPTVPTGTDAEVTWHRDVRPLTDVHCAGCHEEGGIAPFTFDDPAIVGEIYGPSMVAAVEARTMPPFSFEPGCREIEDDQRLDEATIAVFTRWQEGGFAIGAEADYVAPTLSEPVPPPPPDLVGHPIRAFELDPHASDEYLCLVSDVAIDEETFVIWSDMIPEHAAVVHHTFAYAVPPERLDELEDLADGDLDHQFPCWGTPVVYLGPVIGGWVPGLQPSYEATRSATRVPAGSKIVLEVHYNLLGAVDPPPTDATAVRLWTIPEAEVEDLFVIWTAYDKGMVIPAGDPHVVEGLNARLPIEGAIVSSNPHMHLLGTELQSRILRADGAEQCVSDVAYDFHWQWDYTFPRDQEVPYSAAAGDSVELTCVYDNSPEHQPIVDGVRQPPREVGWGDSSLDEMCIDFYVFRTPYDRTASRGLCAGYDHCYQACPPGDPECPLVCMGTAGEGCFSCGIEAMVGGCSVSRCPVQSAAYLACMATCQDLISDFFGCQVEECARALDRYQACAQPLFADGTCARDYEACSGLVP